ncbi:MAG: exodeoxyribonuclease VII small subunit [Anaerolineales bacterium]
MNPTMELPPEGKPPVDQMTYERALAELEEIVAALEAEEHPLEESLALYERGQALAQHCTSLLDKAHLKVQQLSGEELTDFVDGPA